MAKNRSTSRAAETSPFEPDLDRALQIALELMAIPGPSGQEAKVVEFLSGRLREAGVDESQLAIDDTPRHSPLGGETGGLILKLPGTRRGPRRMLVAHIDTVPLCVGSQPVVKGRMVRSADPNTGLGADDRAGAAVLLTTALEILGRDLPHPPLTFFWPAQEEVGLHGARFVKLSKLGNLRLAFNWDGGDSDKLTVGATGAYRMDIAVTGIASHAGGAPEKGVSAIAIAALAIAELHRGGWHGDIQKNGRHGTSNVGVIRGGQATNVVTDRVDVRAEARSHDPNFRKEIVKRIETAFRQAAGEVTSDEGRRGKVSIDSHLDYESFVLPDDEPCVAAGEAAIRSIGREPIRAIANGGLDANWLTARGLPTVTIGCGQLNQHTVREALDVAGFQRACRIALRLATGD